MLLEIFTIIVSLVILFVSANFFIDGAIAVARRLGMSSLLVGVIIIGFGTSVPEIIVSTFAALDGSSGISLGNAYGSNIINIGLVLGLAALISPISMQRKILLVEIPILLAISLFSFLILRTGQLSRLHAASLLSIFAIYMGYTLFQSKKESQLASATQSIPSDLAPLWKSLITLLAGLTALALSARGFVWGASRLASTLGVSDLIIGLTVVSLGTSLPELSSTIVAAAKRQHDMALGNIIGSNIFNTLVVVGIAGVISPIHDIDPIIISRDIPVMLLMSLLLFFFSLSRKKVSRINRIEGAIFILLYLGYLAILFKTL
jgi:cation:H+ antiporter